jgi:hypothetical protein
MDLIQLASRTSFANHADEIAGRIVLVRHELMFAAGTIHRRIKYQTAVEAGAVGFLIAGPSARNVVASSLDPDGKPASLRWALHRRQQPPCIAEPVPDPSRASSWRRWKRRLPGVIASFIIARIYRCTMRAMPIARSITRTSSTISPTCTAEAAAMTS